MLNLSTKGWPFQKCSRGVWTMDPLLHNSWLMCQSEEVHEIYVRMQSSFCWWSPPPYRSSEKLWIHPPPTEEKVNHCFCTLNWRNVSHSNTGSMSDALFYVFILVVWEQNNHWLVIDLGGAAVLVNMWFIFPDIWDVCSAIIKHLHGTTEECRFFSLLHSFCALKHSMDLALHCVTNWNTGGKMMVWCQCFQTEDQRTVWTESRTGGWPNFWKFASVTSHI